MLNQIRSPSGIHPRVTLSETWYELGALGWEGHEGDVRRHDEPAREVPSGPVDEEHGMGSQRHLGCDLGQVQVHGFGVAGRQDQGSSLALARADGAEDVG